ncbi:MAG: MotA/TolQ/ExbB proton channel family protein [Deltaproteobacteria bacterium]|jgi:biopolymer transport protein ExbB|nr:MotA/TolQ/ExbB proton channel family protein [Deltaproteobacteria bacterium]
MEALESIWASIQTGGPVMFPLIVVSVWMWHLIALKVLWVFRVRRNRLGMSQALEYMSSRKSGFSKETVLNDQGPKGEALAHFLGHRRFDPESDRIMWEAAVQRQISPLNHHMSAILVLAAVAPLLGLLGTVTGMVDTFRVIGMEGTGNPQALASGIEEALVTTQTGLLIAIPGLLVGQTLRKQIKNIQGDLMIFYRAVDQWLERRQNHV